MPHFLYRIQPTRPGMLADGPTEREAKVVLVRPQRGEVT